MKKYNIPTATVISVAKEDIMALSAEAEGYGISGISWDSLFEDDAMSL